MKKAIILFSGGLDSTTCLTIAKAEGFTPYALSIHYGQKHHAELNAAKYIAQQYGAAEHKIITINLDHFGGSALTDQQIPIEDFKNQDQNNIPNTYVPARNTVFLSLALSWAETLHAYDIFIGANVMDYSGYPDCRPEYLTAFENLANLATKVGVEGEKFKIHAPLLLLTKAQIIQKGIALGMDYALTVSCYRLDHAGRACGRCDSCIYRKKGFQEAGIPDPTHYQDSLA